jgi:hypothetical protein
MAAALAVALAALTAALVNRAWKRVAPPAPPPRSAVEVKLVPSPPPGPQQPRP